jgi:hypothetical protein
VLAGDEAALVGACVSVSSALEVKVITGRDVGLGVGVCARRQDASPKLSTSSKATYKRKVGLLNTHTPGRKS